MLSEVALLRAGRTLLALLFVAGAVQKAVSPDAAQTLLANAGLPIALIWPALIFNASVGAALFAGWRLYPVSLAAAAYCLATSLFHFQPDDGWQMSIMVKNGAIAGGFLILAAAARDRA